MADRWQDVMQNNYGTPGISLVKGEGVHVWDEDGKRYLDFLGGIATNVLGHAHPVVVKAVSQQIGKLGHTSNLYAHPQGIDLARKLQVMTGDPKAKVFFCNSGAEANEAAIKISRLTGRTQIIAAEGGFHGRTMGALSITGQEPKRLPFKPLLNDVKFVKFGSIDALRKAISRKTAMVILEAIQGENGVVVPPNGYLRQVQALCDEFGVLLAIDAVQTGIGRTGEWFGFEHAGIHPNIITLAKGLGGGLPLGAMITMGSKTPNFKPGEHGSTFGGNPVSCAASNAVLDFIRKKDLLSKTRDAGDFLKGELVQIPGVQGVRGRGLLLGIELKGDTASTVQAKALSKGLLVNAPNKSIIRIAPSLSVKKRDLKEFVQLFAETMSEVYRG